MGTRNYRKHHCPIAQALAALGDQWTLLIVRDAVLLGPRRFGELQKSLGISRNLLARRLVQLCASGILERVEIAGSARHAYAPTEKCQDLKVVILAMAKWGEKWGSDPQIHQLDILEKNTGRPVAVEFIRTKDCRIVAPADIEIVRQGAPGVRNDR